MRGMLVFEAAQEECQCLRLLVQVSRLGANQIVVNVVPEHDATGGSLNQLASDFGCNDFRYVFMLGNCRDLVVRQIAQVDAIL